MSSGPQLENDLVVEDGARTRSAPSRRPRFAVPPKRIAPFNVPIVLDNYYSAAPRRLRLRGNEGDDGAQDSSGMSFAAAFEDNVWERSASMGDLNNTPGESQDENTLKPGALECIAFALCGVGVSVGWTTVLANLTYFCGLYGKSSFIWLNVAVYGPTLPFAIIQTAFDQRFDARFGSSRAFSFRLVTALLSMAVLMVLYPILLATPASVQAGKDPINLGWVLLITSIIGCMSAIAYGSFYQISSLMSYGGRCPAFFALGYQGSGLIALGLATASQFGTFHDATRGQLWGFFGGACAFEFLALSFFLALLWRSSTFAAAMRARDRWHARDNEIRLLAKEALGSPLLRVEAEDSRVSLSSSTSSMRCVLWKTWKCMLALFLTVLGNMSIFPFFAYVPSSTGSKLLSMMLFYCKTVSDTLGRPLTLGPKLVRTPNGLLAVAVVRLTFVPIFFVYTFAKSEWIDGIRSDWIACVSVGIFSMLSGYLNTIAYAMAPTLVDRNEATTSANILNLAFHMAVYIALAISVVVRYSGIDANADV